MMWDSFSPQLRNVALTAQKEANGMNSSSLNAAHFLLALAHEHDGVLARHLHVNKIGIRHLCESLESQLQIRSSMADGPTFMSGQAARLFDLATAEARNVGAEAVETLHLLLALTDESNGHVAKVLADMGLTREEILRQNSQRNSHPPDASATRLSKQVALRRQHHGLPSSFTHDSGEASRQFVEREFREKE